jgi:hypothetical protein
MEEVKQLPPLGKTQETFQLAEHRRNLWTARVPQGTGIDRVSEPDYWVHVTKDLRVDDKIEVKAADGSWYAEFLVTKVEKHAAHVWLILYADRYQRPAPVAQAAPAESGEAGHKIEFGGGHKWRVIRLSDKQVIHKGEPDEESAKAWLAEHLKAA